MGIPALVINLDRSTDRLAHVRAEFARVGMGFERVAAVDGTNLPASLQPYFCNAAGELISKLRPGEIGCYASHLAIWQRVAVSDTPTLVCEDDITLPDGFRALVNATLAAAPAGW